MSENPFRPKMETKNETQFLHVLNNKKQFRPKAVEAADQVLRERAKRKQQEKTSPDKIDPIPVEPKNEDTVNPRYSLRAIATYQLISCLAIMPTLFSLFTQVISDFLHTLILLFFTVLYLTGIISALLIFQKKYAGIVTSLIFNFFQSLYFQAGTFAYFSTGIFAIIYIFPLSFNGYLGTNFLMSFSQAGDLVIGFNLIACTAFSFVLNAEMEISENGKFPDHLY